jgi:1-deoxy-D-xylulose-5-phosphate reductoisomerase
MQHIGIIGSTGSIGTSTLSIVRRFPERFKIASLVAHQNLPLLAAQVEEFSPHFVGVSGKSLREVREFSSLKEAVVEAQCAEMIAALPLSGDIVAASVGFAGLRSVLAALKSGKRVFLANKESLVVGGGLIRKLIGDDMWLSGKLFPIDSEHASLYKLLLNERKEKLAKVTLTASGGPFREASLSTLEQVTPEMAIKHPTWSMGKKISVDSSTLVNKGLELIEASYLFNLPYEMIDVVMHPESLVHAIVTLIDGTSRCDMSVPNMEGAIAAALCGFNEILGGVLKPLNFPKLGNLHFLPVREDCFRGIALARLTAKNQQLQCAFNSSNEWAVAKFLRGEIPFLDIYRYIEEAMSKELPKIDSIEDIEECDRVVQEICTILLKRESMKKRSV